MLDCLQTNKQTNSLQGQNCFVFFKLMTTCLHVVSGAGGVCLFVLQETGGVGGGQQPDRGDLPDLAATANHLVLASPALAYQRLRQPGTGLQIC